MKNFGRPRFGYFHLAFYVFFLLLHISCGQSQVGGSLWGTKVPRIQITNTDELYRFLTYDEKRYPLVSAHRGGPGEGLPENAIETFAYHSKHQPIIIECDIRMSKDSVLVLMHDETLTRTSNGKGRISDHTAEELKQFLLKDRDGNITSYRIPTLDEALQWGKGKVIFTLDVKRGVPYQRVVDVIQRNRAEHLSIIITYNADQVLEVHRLDPSLMISASINSAQDLLRLTDRGIPDNRIIAFVGTREAKSSTYDLLHGHGIMCILGTLGNLDRRAERSGPELYMEFVERGADILSTDRPEVAGEALETYRREHRLQSEFVK